MGVCPLAISLITDSTGKPIPVLFRHAVWLIPAALREWDRVRTIGIIRQVFPMYELTLDGLEAAVRRLVAKNQVPGLATDNTPPPTHMPGSADMAANLFSP